MLSYAYTVLRHPYYEEIAGESFEHIHSLFAAILAKGIGQQLKHGLYRTYVSRQENMTVMRGKINLSETMQNQIAHKRTLVCTFDDFSENNQLNQILKTTAILLIYHKDVDVAQKYELKKVLLYFSAVDTLDPYTVRWQSIRFQRDNQTYRMLIGICRFVIEGMLLTTERGAYQLASFVDEERMCRLYEKFILEYYRKEYPKLSVSAAQIPWVLDDDSHALLPVMQSDITLARGNTVLIIDAKYYQHTMQMRYDKQTLHSANLYQIFTYVKNKDALFADEPHTVSGMLLYAKTDEEIQPDQTYQMSGNRISVKTLDLNRPFPEIAAQLNAIVAEHFAIGKDGFKTIHASANG